MSGTTDRGVDEVRAHYEAFPFPNGDRLSARISPSAGALAMPSARKILVAGAGTLEPLIVAAMNPQASVTAVDISGRSLAILRERAVRLDNAAARVEQMPEWAQAALKSLVRNRLFVHGGFERIQTVQADLHEDLRDRLGDFDFVICTGVIHHSQNPEKLLANLSALLAAVGSLRLMMYAPHSRRWIYALQKYFKAQGIGTKRQATYRECEKALARLPETHALRAHFELYTDAFTTEGLLDGFFHPCDRPIAWPRLERECARNGLALLRAENELPKYPDTHLSLWQELEVTDLLGEMDRNPVLWFSKQEASSQLLRTQTRIETAPLPVDEAALCAIEILEMHSSHAKDYWTNWITENLPPHYTRAGLRIELSTGADILR